jgi:type II secretory pathway pseudopilin PulG
LLEIAVVLAMIGTLASIAIPAFTKYIRKARTSEARTNLETIRALARSYYLDHRRYPVCAPSPPAVPGRTPGRFVTSPCWTALGFRPDTHVYYQYETSMDGDIFVAKARGDLDDNGKLSLFQIRLDGTTGDGEIRREDELE